MSYITIDQIGGACPFQAEGTLLDCPFYLRARHGEFYIVVSLPGTEPITALYDEPENVLLHITGDDDTDGFMETEEGMTPHQLRQKAEEERNNALCELGHANDLLDQIQALCDGSGVGLREDVRAVLAKR